MKSYSIRVTIRVQSVPLPHSLVRWVKVRLQPVKTASPRAESGRPRGNTAINFKPRVVKAVYKPRRNQPVFKNISRRSRSGLTIAA